MNKDLFIIVFINLMAGLVIWTIPVWVAVFVSFKTKRKK